MQLKHKGIRCKKAETGGAGGDIRSRRGELSLKSSQKGEEVLITFSIELLLLLESTLQGGDLVL